VTAGQQTVPYRQRGIDILFGGTMLLEIEWDFENYTIEAVLITQGET
jgi:hypothetical protein